MLLRLERSFDATRQVLARRRPEIPQSYLVTTCQEVPDQFQASVELENETWDDLSFLDYTAAHHAYYDELLAHFPDFRICMTDSETGEMVATGMCVPLHVPKDKALPREGWDWIVETAHEQHGRQPNTVAALSISVPEEHRHRGLARDMIYAMRTLAALKDISAIIAPVRPSAKCQYPFVPMDQYVGWRDPRGRMFDPWLRSHLAAGGRLESVCDRSMVVEQPLEFWRDWTGSSLTENGLFEFHGALTPLAVDVEHDVGRYVEPNVWVRHLL